MIMHGPWYIHEDVVHVKHILVVHLLKSNSKLKAWFLKKGTDDMNSSYFLQTKINILFT